MNSSNTYIHNLGVVVKKNIGTYHVRANGRVLLYALSTRLRSQLVYPLADRNTFKTDNRQIKNPDQAEAVAVGDLVRFTEVHIGTSLIVEVLPRRNRFTRRDPYPGGHPFEQIIVANVDCIAPVFAAANKTPKWGMLDRYLVSAESQEIPVLIIITKIDLVCDCEASQTAEIGQVVDEYRRIGYPVLLTSAVTGQGIDELHRTLKDRITAFVGKSGVGKTAMLNAIEPGLGLRIGEVGRGRVGKGKHTTSHAEMVTLSFGGEVVDTPGMREFGLHGMNGYNLAVFFPEMRPFVGKCRFGLGCLHDEEPGCAVRKAVMAGRISLFRYQSYLRLKEEI